MGTENTIEVGSGDDVATTLDGEETVSEGVTFEAAADGSQSADGKIVSETSEGLEGTGNNGADDTTDKDATTFNKVGDVADVNGRSADSEDVTVAESPATDGNVSGDDASATLKGTLSTDGNEAPAEIDSALDANGGSADNQNDSESVDLEEENKEATKDDKELWSEAAAKDSMSEDEGVSNADIFDQGNNKVMDYSQDKSNESVDQNDSEWDDEEEKYNEEEEENENFSSGGSAENRDADDSQDNVDNTGWNSPFNGQSETQGVNEVSFCFDNGSRLGLILRLVAIVWHISSSDYPTLLPFFLY